MKILNNGELFIGWLIGGSTVLLVMIFNLIPSILFIKLNVIYDLISLLFIIWISVFIFQNTKIIKRLNKKNVKCRIFKTLYVNEIQLDIALFLTLILVITKFNFLSITIIFFNVLSFVTTMFILRWLVHYKINRGDKY